MPEKLRDIGNVNISSEKMRGNRMTKRIATYMFFYLHLTHDRSDDTAVD